MKDGGPAFPTIDDDHGHYGMSLRDWFAGQALIGIMSDPGMRPSLEEEFPHMAMRLYQVADAMVSEKSNQ